MRLRSNACNSANKYHQRTLQLTDANLVGLVLCCANVLLRLLTYVQAPRGFTWKGLYQIDCRSIQSDRTTNALSEVIEPPRCPLAGCRPFRQLSPVSAFGDQSQRRCMHATSVSYISIRIHMARRLTRQYTPKWNFSGSRQP